MKCSEQSHIPGENRIYPTLVLLHGLLGSKDDWLPIQRHLSPWPSIALDLPGHGTAAEVRVDNFPAVEQWLNTRLQQEEITDYWLVGYSLGGRVAMYHTCQGKQEGLKGLIVEGSHPGLSQPAECAARIERDQVWADRFRRQPLTDVVTDWYQQEVFADLSLQEQLRFIQLRQSNNGAGVAAMLMATSLGRQPYLGAALQQLKLPCYFICGERDHKFKMVAQQQKLSLHQVQGAGHNVHQQQPVLYAELLKALLTQHL